MTETVTGTINSYDGTQLAYYVNQVERPKGWIVFAHGLTAYALRYDNLAERLNEHGYSVLRYDHRGHGQSGGERVYLETGFELIDDAYEVHKLAKKMAGELPLFFMGHSMGGYTAIGFGCKYSDEVKGIIITAASCAPPNRAGVDLSQPMDPHEKMPVPGSKEVGKKANGEPITDAVTASFVYKGLYRALQYLGKWMTGGAVKNFTAPCLIVHGLDDLIVPAVDSERLLAEISSTDKKRVELEGVGHSVYLPQNFDKTVVPIIEFLNEHI